MKLLAPLPASPAASFSPPAQACSAESLEVSITHETSKAIGLKFMRDASISTTIKQSFNHHIIGRAESLQGILKELLKSQTTSDFNTKENSGDFVVTVKSASDKNILTQFIAGILQEELTLTITTDQARRIYTYYGIDSLSNDQARITDFNQYYLGRAPEKVAFVLSQYCQTHGSNPYPVKALTDRSGYTLTANSISEHQQLTKFLEALPEYPRDTAPPPYTVATDAQQVSIPANITIIEAALQKILSNQWLPNLKLPFAVLSFFQKPNLTFGSSIDSQSSSIRLFFEDAEVAKKIFEKINTYLHHILSEKDRFNTFEKDPNNFCCEIRLSFDECESLVQAVNQTLSLTKR